MSRSDSIAQLLRGCLMLAAITALAWLAFGAGLNHELLNWDDDRNFAENEAFRGLGSEQLHWAWSTYHMGVWQPASWLLLGLQYTLFGLDPWGYRVFSIVMHSANCALLYAIMVSILRLANPIRSMLPTRLVCGMIALLFAVHPLRIEAVNWVSCQPYLPAICFFLLGVLAYLKGARPDGRMSRAWLAAAWVCYCLAVASKAVAVTLPVVLLILDWYPLRRIGGPQGWRGSNLARIAVEKIPFFLVAILISIWASEAKAFNESRLPLEQYQIGSILAQGAYGYCFYLWKTLCPAGLCSYYRLPENLSIASWPYWAIGCALVIATSTIWRLRRKYPGLWAAWLAYGVILLPNVGVIQFSAQITADRYAYLATMPLIVLLAAAVLRLVRRMTRTILVTSTLAGMACLIPLVIVSRQDVMNWQNSVALWKLVLKADDQCAVAAANLGHALMAKEDFAHARPMLVRAIELDPALTIAGVNLGACDYFTRHYQQAIHTLEDALSTDPPLAIADQGKAHATLGACYAALRKDDLAWPHALRARNLGYAKAQQLIDYLSKFSRPPTTTPSSAP